MGSAESSLLSTEERSSFPRHLKFVQVRNDMLCLETYNAQTSLKSSERDSSFQEIKVNLELTPTMGRDSSFSIRNVFSHLNGSDTEKRMVNLLRIAHEESKWVKFPLQGVSSRGSRILLLESRSNTTSPYDVPLGAVPFPFRPPFVARHPAPPEPMQDDNDYGYDYDYL